MRTRRLCSDARGAVAIEMAFALPVVVMLMIGILQFALVLQASGAMRHGIGEGLRFAKVNAIADPDDAAEVAALEQEVEDVAMAALAGMDRDGIKSIEFTSGTDASGARFGRIDVIYGMKPIIPFAPLPEIALSESRQAFLPS
jgi:hypothetical protein